MRSETKSLIDQMELLLASLQPLTQEERNQISREMQRVRRFASEDSDASMAVSESFSPHRSSPKR